ncbi:MAG: hypothetical protein HON76_08120 [Candidatus Scalindua sp.]|jgi:hypothetical protein|nr:hypothetical protein [Candidatus Scalindua sp.]MBT5303706.1 hypothetical protein [Candidatus Scalindua sp.]MBT6228882.1 hypothetical protein [Candidatus Scalindua sp.]MBT6562477.1 hypothetical protein [Candidatus Scalindua sp.]MBT7211807.1 hypothetical protein [Candidatus Scalindua sp.]
MEIKFLQTRITKLTKILLKIAIMFLIMAGIILISKKYMNSAEGSEKDSQKISIERVITPGFNLETRWEHDS